MSTVGVGSRIKLVSPCSKIATETLYMRLIDEQLFVQFSFAMRVKCRYHSLWHIICYTIVTATKNYTPPFNPIKKVVSTPKTGEDWKTIALAIRSVDRSTQPTID